VWVRVRSMFRVSFSARARLILRLSLVLRLVLGLG
jgi:hypothetical protein